ncbi:MAG: cell wall hydrolase [Sphingomicrobium sp.]
MPPALTLQRPLDGLRHYAARVARLTVGRARSLWRSHPRETAGFGLFGLVATAAIAASVVQPLQHGSAPAVAPPAPPPLLMRQIAPDQAIRVNADIPLAGGPNVSAVPFALKGSAEARAQALECLSSAVYYEAGSQDDDGERGVAQVVLNRVRHPAFPASVCATVYQGSTRATGCQFTFTCDGSMARLPDSDGWNRAKGIARAALAGYVFKPVGLATHYHANYVVPYWASTLSKNAIVGAHIFYRWAGGWGQPAAFVEAYAGTEPNARALRSAALAAPHVAPQTAEAIASIDQIPGAEAIKLSPSMRGDKRVAVRFNLIARKASDEVEHEDYTRAFDASDTLKWSLSGDSPATSERPLGTSSSAAPAPAATQPASGQR